MNALEMQYKFEQRTGNLFNYDPYTRIRTPRIEDLLNLSQDLEFKDIYSRFVGSSRTKFEFTEKIRRELSNLIDSRIIQEFDSTSSARHKNSVFVTLPKDFLYATEERAEIRHSDGSTALADVKPMTHDEYLENKDNPFLWPDDELVWRMDYGLTGPTGATGAKRHELLHHSDYTVTKYKVRYLRRPQSIIMDPSKYQNCELDASTHEKIVNRAVSMAPRKAEKQQSK